MAKAATKAPKTTRAKTSAARTKTAAPKKTRTASTKARAPLAPRLPRRAIFIDVENTSSETALFETIESLAIDRRAYPTELAAVGNWRAVGQMVGRRLGALGAQLVHSAPARGVRDWSDLWIAVAAGCWLGQAAPGDVLEIVSNDRAFDAVGDAAAARGVVFRRLQHRHSTASAQPAEPRAPAARAPGARSSRRRGGRGRGGRRTTPSLQASHAPVAAANPPPTHAVAPHGASAVQIAHVIQRLTNGEPARWVNLDVLEKALKSEGHSRPPGSPRLVTRLRALKEMEVDSHGRVRLRQHAPATEQSASAAE